MAYKQSPLAYSRTSNMPGLEYSEEDLAQKERIASNALGITPPADLLDGEFFLKDNDPQDFYRTLYIKRGESLDKVVTFTDTGKTYLQDYYTKKETDYKFFNKETDILDKKNGGLGKQLTSTDASGIMYVSLESNETDINTMIKSGMYKCYRWINYPSDAGYTGQGFLYVFNWKETGSGSEIGYGFQLYINPSGKIYKRYRLDSTFKQWKLIQNYDGSIPVDIGGTGTTVGALPFSSRVKESIVVSDDFSIDLNVGELISILFKGATKEVIIQTYIQNGTYLLHWFRQRKDTKELFDNNSIVKVVTPSTKTGGWNSTLEGMCNIIRIK